MKIRNKPRYTGTGLPLSRKLIFIDLVCPSTSPKTHTQRYALARGPSAPVRSNDAVGVYVTNKLEATSFSSVRGNDSSLLEPQTQ